MAKPKPVRPGAPQNPQEFESKSPWSLLQREVHQHWELRKPLLERIQKHYDAYVVSFFTSFRVRSEIEDMDAEMLESLLSAEYRGGKLMLVLNSPGGFALAAERIVNVCRAYSNGKFEVIVPHMAKSAATMICFGASKLHMSKTAELGPVDPQVPYKDASGQWRWISADEYVRSYEQLFSRATNSNAKHIEPHLQQLQRFDARYIEYLKSTQRLSTDISVRLLKSGMMAKSSKKSIQKRIDVFLSQPQTSAHARMINFAQAEQCGLAVESVDLRSDVWNALWELYVRSDWVVSMECAKLIESATTHLHAAAMEQPTSESDDD
jgi:hypothetical protein